MSYIWKGFSLTYRQIHRYPHHNGAAPDACTLSEQLIDAMTGSHFQDVQYRGSYVSFGHASNSWLAILAGGEITFSTDRHNVTASYTLKLNILGGLIALLPFISLLHPFWHRGIVYTTAASLLLLCCGLFKIHSTTRWFDRLVTTSVQTILDTYTCADISEEQRQWIEDPTRCPACGASIDRTSTHCGSCGLFLQRN